MHSFIHIFNLALSHHYSLFLMGISGQQQSYPPKLWSCDETSSYDHLFADCGEPIALSVGVFHPNLTDIFTDYIDVRTTPALTAIAGSRANVLCVPELYSPNIRQQLNGQLTDVSGVFSDSFPISPDSDLTDQENKPPVYKDPVCTGDLQTALAEFEGCLLDPALVQANCTASVGTPDASDSQHYFAATGSLAIGCAAQACQTQVSNFVLAGSHDAEACFMCAIAHLSSGESIEAMYEKCTTSNQGNPHYVYDGSTGLVLLYNSSSLTPAPGESPEVIQLPSSTWKRSAMRVPLKITGNGAIVDFWCANVRAPNSESFLPNGGPYYGYDANGQPNAAGVENIETCNSAEENLQISRLISAVNSRATAANRRAIIAALTYTSPQIGADVNNPIITGLHPENFALFENPPWEELTVANYTPQCTFCNDNPLNTGNDRQWSVHLFGVGIGAAAVTETKITYEDQTVLILLYSTSDNTTKTLCPVSQYYGIQSTVRVTQ